MLRLYQSDKLEYLAQLLAEQNLPPASPFQPETIVVQSQGMGRWISLRLAEQLGVCAHTRFCLPASFVWDLLREFFGDLPRRSAFSCEVLTFRVMDWLGQPENLRRAPRLQGYLRDGRDLRRLQLATRIADVFDQYLVYREDWIRAWENGDTLGLDEDERWQALLWRDLSAAEPATHRARLMGELLRRLGRGDRPLPQDEEITARLPRRLTVFGVSALPPVFLNVLHALSEHIDVSLYALNPCREYWGEIRDPREIGRLARDSRPEDLYLEVGHPLLASLGKQGREFFDSLAECAEPYGFFRDEPPRDSILRILQADILELVDRRTAGRLPVSAADRSLQIHVCHSPMREVEVLRDQLLALFDRMPGLEPGDVAVLTPDIERYTPYIEAVFAASRDTPYIPYSIADRGQRHQHPLLESFLALLDLPDCRFPVDATLGFLEQPAILRKFGLGADDLPLVHGWARAVGTRWGRDGTHKGDYQLPEIPRHTWRDSLQRLLLGYALPQELAGGEPPLFGATLPYDDIEGSRALVLGRFAEFLETLFEWADRLGQTLPLSDWADRLGLFADRLFDPRDEDEATLLQLRGTFDLLRELADQAGFREPVDIRTVRCWLAERLGQPSGSVGFLTGCVTFCAMVPMRSLPFKVVAVLGLDHDSFPRHRHPPGFDLLARHPRRGDRSRRVDDRYLFLETLLSAREVLYLSYVGRDIRDNGERPPSPLVSELVDVARQSCELAEGDLERHLITEHPLQPFDPGYFRADPRLPGFSNTWLAAARLLGRGDRQPEPLCSAELPEPEDEWRTVDPESLAYFYGNPVRYLLKRRLNIVLESAAPGFEIREPFALDYRSRDQIRKNLLRVMLHDREPASALRLADATGLLPHGPFGAALHGKEQSLVEAFAPELLPDLRTPRLSPLPVEFEADGLRLSGFLGEVGAQGLSDYGFEDPKPRQLLQLWLRHLMLCLAAPPRVARRSLLRTPGKTVVFGPVEDPAGELGKLLKLYWRGLSRPLPFFPKASHCYAHCLSAPPKKLQGNPEAILFDARRQARATWLGSEFGAGEADDPYYRAVYRGIDPLDGEFERLAVEVLGTMLKEMESKEG
jgi:exodeoxyribonuclease V gamma subunit